MHLIRRLLLGHITCSAILAVSCLIGHTQRGTSPFAGGSLASRHGTHRQLASSLNLNGSKLTSLGVSLTAHPNINHVEVINPYGDTCLLGGYSRSSGVDTPDRTCFLLRIPQGEPRPSTFPENVGGALSSTRPDEHGLVQLHPGFFTGRKLVRRLRLHSQLFPGNIVVDRNLS